jgi:hypothetical protein
MEIAILDLIYYASACCDYGVRNLTKTPDLPGSSINYAERKSHEAS